MVKTVLEAAMRQPSIRRVVLTSSCIFTDWRNCIQETNASAGVTMIPIEWNMNPDSERLYTGWFPI
jgi:hypothetical protein